MASPSLHLLLFLLFTLHPASSELILEQGYTVATAADLNTKPSPASASGPHAFALLPRPRSGDLVVLDSTGSALYTLPLPLSPTAATPGIKRLAGNGVRSFGDGDPAAAAFDRPRSFAIDAADNVYVADRLNHAIRKIDRSGFTTTIAGGYSKEPGRKDGPAQNASFSPDFELVYVPRMCALLIADRGNQLIRQIDLKPEDCAHKSQSGLRVTSVSVIAILCVLFGSVLGFIARSFLPLHTGSLHQPLCPQDTEALPSHPEEGSSDELLRHQKRSC